MFDYFKLKRKYNTMEAEYEELKEEVKNDTFNKLLATIGQPLELKRLREENKRLRLKVKELKTLIKE